MALQALSDISGALSLFFLPELQRQMNRHTVGLSLAPKRLGRGKTHNWDVQFSGATAAAYSEGADVGSGDLAQDVSVAASLSWSQYRSAFGVSGLAKATSASSPGSAEELLNIVAMHARNSASKLASVLNSEIYSGSSNIVGLDTALSATGTYAGVSKVTYAEWQGNVSANGGTPRALTKNLMDALDKDIYKACGMSCDFIKTTPEVALKYEALFDATVRHVVDNGEISAASRAMTGKIIRDRSGFTGYSYKGKPIFRDKDATAGHMYFMNMDHYAFLTLPPSGLGQTAVQAMAAALADDKGETAGIMGAVEYLAKLGDSDRFQVKIYPAFVVDRPGAHGLLDDIAE